MEEAVTAVVDLGVATVEVDTAVAVSKESAVEEAVTVTAAEVAMEEAVTAVADLGAAMVEVDTAVVDLEVMAADIPVVEA